MWGLNRIGDAIGSALGSYTEPEVLVREATSEEHRLPSEQILNQLCHFCSSQPESDEVMNMLWYRIINEPTKSWRRVYKALLVLDHLMKNGPPHIVDDIARNQNYLDRIKLFTFLDNDGNDKTVNITHRASEILKLINDHSLLREERKTMKRLQQRMYGSDFNYGKKAIEKSGVLKTKDFIDVLKGSIGLGGDNYNRKSFLSHTNVLYSYGSRAANQFQRTKITQYKDEEDDAETIEQRTENNNYVPQQTKPTNYSHSREKTYEDPAEFGEFVEFAEEKSTTPTFNATPSSVRNSNKNNNKEDKELLLDIFSDPEPNNFTAPTKNATLFHKSIHPNSVTTETLFPSVSSTNCTQNPSVPENAFLMSSYSPADSIQTPKPTVAPYTAAQNASIFRDSNLAKSVSTPLKPESSLDALLESNLASLSSAPKPTSSATR